jgi:hypothetical protein
MEIINYNNKKLAVYLRGEELQKGLNFYSEDRDFIQVGIWGYDKGKLLQAHIHNYVDRVVNRTQEVIYIIRGKVKAFIYSEEAILVKELLLKEGDILILLEGGHGYEIMEDDTFVLEVKNGPYVGPEKDRRRIHE